MNLRKDKDNNQTGSVFDNLRAKSKQRPISQAQSTSNLHPDYNSKMKKWRQFNEYQKLTNNYDWHVGNKLDLKQISLKNVKNNFQTEFKIPNYKTQIHLNHDRSFENNVKSPMYASENIDKYKY